jgi:ABC-2 type transport system permease protein
MFYCKINWFGAFTLLKKETLRFLKVYHQTLFSPTINIILFLAVFSLSMGNHITKIGNVSFSVFIAAGLIIMAAMQNAFANSSSSFVMAKVLGHIIDYLIPPLGAFELLFAFTFGAILRGICVAVISFLTILIFVPLPFYSIFYIVFHLFFACMFLGLLGVLCGLVSETFDDMSVMTSYVITPLTFLSGTFYSTNSLPGIWRNIAHFNPLFYMIDGFRFGITGYHDGNLLMGIIYLACINIALGVTLFFMIKKGYMIKN